jgi:hypothetical protein
MAAAAAGGCADLVDGICCSPAARGLVCVEASVFARLRRAAGLLRCFRSSRFAMKESAFIVWCYL